MDAGTDATTAREAMGSNPIEAFHSLAELNAEFEDFERRVQELAFAGEINFRINYAKGK